MLKSIPNPLLALRASIGRGRPLAVGQGKATPATAEAVASADLKQGQLNPYVEARREWNERYGEYIQQAHHWRLAAIVCALVAMISVSGIVYIGGQSKVVPYVVEVDKLGVATAVARADHAASVDPKVLKASLARFVADWRTVTVDRVAQKGAVDRVYAMLPSGSIALHKMNDYFKAHNPFVIAANRSVAIAVTNLLPISDRTWQVEWQEVTRDGRGAVQGSLRMKASIIVGITPPTDESLILINPLGVYVTDLNWSQQL
jgi:type IV secretion system protein VirB5